MALLTALVQCQLCGTGHQPSPQGVVNRMTKNQLELAKELLRIFNLQHVLAPSNASQRVELNYPNGTRSFVPSNPYWILMNQTLRVSNGHSPELQPPNSKSPGATSTISSNLIPKDSEEAFIMGPQPAQQRASRILLGVKAATTSSQPVYVASPGHRIIPRADPRQNATLFKPPLMQRFTFEDAPRSRPLWYALQQESMTKKIEQAKSMASLKASVNRTRTGVRSGEVDLDPSASSDLKFQPAMRIITSPANSIKHQIPATYNHAFVVLGQPAGKGKPLSSELSRSEVSALGAAFGDLIQGSESTQQPRRGRRYEHVFNIGDKPVLRETKMRAMDVHLQLKPVSAPSNYSSPQEDSSPAKSSSTGVTYHAAASRQIAGLYAASSKFSPIYSIRHHVSESGPQRSEITDNRRVISETGNSNARVGFQPILLPLPKLVSNQRRPPRNRSAYAQSRFLNLDKLHGPSQWFPMKKSIVKRETPANETLQPNSKTDNASTTVSPLLDDSHTVKPGPKWRGISKSAYYKKLNLTTLKMVSQDTFPKVIFATEIRRGPISSISPFDMAPIGSTRRVMTIYGKTMNQKSPQPTRSAQSSQDLSEVDQGGNAKRRSDESDTSKLKYKANVSDKYSERDLRRPDRKEDYLLPARGQDNDPRRPPVDSSPPVDTKFDPKFEAKFDPEFERSRFLKPPPLFPERIPQRPRPPDDDVYPRVRNGPPHSTDHNLFDKPFPERGYLPDRGFPLNKDFPPDNGSPPERGFQPGRAGYSPDKDYPRQDFSPGRRPPHGEAGRAQGPLINDEDDPSRFDEFAAWKQLGRPPITGGYPGAFGQMGFGYPPFRGPQFGGGVGGGLGQGIGTIIPMKKPKFKLLFGKGTLRSPLSLFGGSQQGWYCPCNYYPPAGRFVTTGFPGFWGGLPAGI
ncbi:unnamed protein product [Ixodes hexagonus]